jgi:hypothetical protein
MCASAA